MASADAPSEERAERARAEAPDPDGRPEGIRGLPGSFWVANGMEIFERMAWYGFFAVSSLYITGKVEDGGLGLTEEDRGIVQGCTQGIVNVALDHEGSAPSWWLKFNHSLVDFHSAPLPLDETAEPSKTRQPCSESAYIRRRSRSPTGTASPYYPTPHASYY